MTRNQLLPNYPSNLSEGVVFSIEDNGDISPDTQTIVNQDDWIVLHKDPSLVASVTHVCAQQNDECKCSTFAVGVSSGAHLVLVGTDTPYKISTSAVVNTDYELYAATENGPIANATTGDIRIGSGG